MRDKRLNRLFLEKPLKTADEREALEKIAGELPAERESLRLYTTEELEKGLPVFDLIREMVQEAARAASEEYFSPYDFPKEMLFQKLWDLRNICNLLEKEWDIARYVNVTTRDTMEYSDYYFKLTEYKTTVYEYLECSGEDGFRVDCFELYKDYDTGDAYDDNKEFCRNVCGRTGSLEVWVLRLRENIAFWEGFMKDTPEDVKWRGKRFADEFCDMVLEVTKKLTVMEFDEETVRDFMQKYSDTIGEGEGK